MKRKLFIGSSSEGLPYAKQLKEMIDTECHDWIETHIWNNGSVFTLNKNALDSLLKASRKYDYGIMIATKDDIVKSKGIKKSAPRDNVMLELGMFLGSLGLTRAFLLLEKENKLPTDYSGVTVPYFQKKIKGSLEKAIDQIIAAIRQTKNSYNLKPMPSAALALGYFDNLILPLAKRRQKENILYNLKILLPKSITDISSEKVEFANQNPSTEISVFGDGKRPVVFQFNDKENHYWDIPTTLSTINRLMDIMLPTSEIGVSPERNDWIEHELRNFKGTLDVLVQQSTSCKGKVIVESL